MTFFDWAATDQGQKFILALIGAVAGFGAWLRSRSTGKKVDVVHTLVNGAATAREARNVQLENYIVANGLPIPPTPTLVTDDVAPVLPLIPPPRQGT